METSAASAPPSAARRARLNGPRATALAALVLVAALAGLWIQTWPLTDGAGLCATVAAAALAWLTWRFGGWIECLAMLATSGAAAWQALHFAATQQILDARQPAAVAVALGLAALAAVALAALCRWPTPSRALALATSLGASLWIGNLAWSRFLPDRLITNRVWAARTEDATFVDRDDGLGSRFAPHSRWTTVYPSNPRGYFDCRPRWGPHDVRLFSIHADPQAKATAIAADGPPATMRFEITQLAPQGNEWQVRGQLWRIPVLAGETYELRMRCRADAPRQAGLMLSEAQPPFKQLAALDVFDVTEAWQDVVWKFRAARDAPQADLMMPLGQSTAAMELADFSLTPLEGKLDMQAWTCHNADVSRATLEPYDPRSRSLRLRVRRARTMSKVRAEAAQGPLRLVGGVEYCLEFWARAEQPQTVNLSVYEPAPKWEAIGLQQTIRFETAWQAFRLSFTAARDSQDAMVGFMAGQKTGLVELSDVSLRCERPAENFVFAQYVIQSQANSMGYRDRQRDLQAAEGVVRIACLGDSHTMGQGVQTDDMFTVRLERILNQDAPEAGRFEVLNFGHSGYDTMQERMVYELEAAAYRPQVVLVCMTENDDVSWTQESKEGIHAPPTPAEKLLAPLGEIRRRRQVRPTRDFGNCVVELEKLHAACQSSGAKLAVMIAQHRNSKLTQDLFDTVAPAMERLGVPVLNPAPQLEELGKEQDLNVHAIDGHPNDIAHARFAELMAEFLNREGLLKPPEAAEKPVMRIQAE